MLGKILPFARVPLLKLYWQGATSVLPSRAHVGPDLSSKHSCPRIVNNFGTASYQLPSSKLVLNGDCVVQKSEVEKL